MKKEEVSLEGVAFQNLVVYIFGTIVIGICTFGIAYILHLFGIGFWRAVIISYLVSSGVILFEIIKRVRKNNDDYYMRLVEESNEFIKFVFDE